MPDQTPILSLPNILPAQAQKHVTHNEALRLLDVMVQLAVLNRTLAAAPALPAIGDRHIVATGAVGAWAGQVGKVALYTTTGWQFFAPLAGWRAYVLAEAVIVVFSGTVWAALPADTTAPIFGVNTTADTTNRLSVQSAATLLSHNGAGHQLKVNKATVGDTASLLFQTGFSGRAEMGLAGSDGFAIKVSPDGTAFAEALAVDPATASVTLGKPAILTGQASDPASPANGTIWHNSTSGEVKIHAGGVTQALGGGSGVADGDKGDVVVSGTGTVWTIDAGAVTLAKMADVATDSFLGRDTAGTGAPEALTPAQARGILNVADGATANATDAALRDRATHTGTQPVGTIAGLAAIATSGSAADLGSGTLPAARFDDTAHGVRAGGALHAAATTTVGGFMTGADKTKLDGIAAGAQVNVDTDLSYTPGTRVLASSTGTDATLPLVTSADAGLAPASGGGTTNFLRADGTWATPAGGGGGAPGGTTGQVQFNNAGVFDGAANAEISGGNLKLLNTVDPAAPTGGLLLYAKAVAGRSLPKIIGPSGIDTVLQTGLHGNSVFMVSPSNGSSVPTVIGGAISTSATISHIQTFASANPWQATRRSRFQTSTTAGNASGVRTAYAQWFLGNATGFGGFFFRAQIGMNINLTGGQKFCGLCATGALLAGDPSALLNIVGMGYDAADASTGNWKFMRNDGSGTATKVDLGTDAARNTTHGFDLTMFAKPNSAEIFVRIVNLHTGILVLDTSYTTDIPALNTGLAFKCDVRNGAVAAADNIEIAKCYIETDY